MFNLHISQNRKLWKARLRHECKRAHLFFKRKTCGKKAKKKNTKLESPREKYYHDLSDTSSLYSFVDTKKNWRQPPTTTYGTKPSPSFHKKTYSMSKAAAKETPSWAYDDSQSYINTGSILFDNGSLILACDGGKSDNTRNGAAHRRQQSSNSSVSFCESYNYSTYEKSQADVGGGGYSIWSLDVKNIGNDDYTVSSLNDDNRSSLGASKHRNGYFYPSGTREEKFEPDWL